MGDEDGGDGGRLSSASRAEEHIPVALRVSAGWSWRLILTGAAIYILLMAVGRVRVVVIPIIAGLLIAALIHPLVVRFQRMGVPRLGAAFAALFVFLVVVAGAAVAVGFNAADELPTVTDQVSEGVEQVRGYLTNGPFHLSQSQLDDLVDDIRRNLANNRGRVVSGVISGASVAAEVITGLLVALFSSFFFLYDGERIWNWIVTRFPDGAEERVRGAGREAWFTITGYVRGTVFVAAVDAFSIGMGLLGVGVPLVAPLALLTFFGGFVPIIGATVAGIAAVLVTLVSGGVTDALIILGVVLAVQQIEGHLLQPIVMRRAVRLHPLAIVISLSAGGVLAGIPGAIAAVPFVAVVNRVASYLAATGKSARPDRVDPDDEGSPTPEEARA
nr:AI-2E family transporter [Frankia canadensis]